MKKSPLLFALLGVCASVVAAEPPAPLTTLRAVSALSMTDAERRLPVAFEGTVTFFRSFEGTLFVQDGEQAIYVRAATKLDLLPGDRVLIKGNTYTDFRTNVESSDIALLHHGPLPAPVPVTFAELMQNRSDCRFVLVRGVVRSADVELSAGYRVTHLEMATESGYITVTMNNGDPERLKGWLDSEVEVAGVASGKFDGKMQQTGAQLQSPSFAALRILRNARQDPWALPVTSMDKVLRTYDMEERTGRVHVEGTLTYYHQMQEAVLQDGSRSIRILTPQIDPLRVGDHVEAIGIPFVDEGFLTLKLGAIRASGAEPPIVPVLVQAGDLAASRHAFDLVSIDGTMVSQSREQTEDTYIISSKGHVFFAEMRHPFVYEWGVAVPPPPLPAIAPGSQVRVTGVALLDNGNPFNRAMGFKILLRTADDVAVLAPPSWLNVHNLMRIVIALLVLMIVAGAYAWWLQQKVHRQTAALATRVEAEAQVERRRGEILENINKSQPLSDILTSITEFVSFRLQGAICWCETVDQAQYGKKPQLPTSKRVLRQEIPGRPGAALGAIYAAIGRAKKIDVEETVALLQAAALASLAIETSRLHFDLVHRSEFDLLTDIPNRFSLEKQLDETIQEARKRSAAFGFVFIDLDGFKLINDQFGHHVGDLYLQQAALRMKHQLRPGDSLARLGGDEFAAVISAVDCRRDAQEAAERIGRSFANPFSIDGRIIHGSASVGIALYPEDAADRDGLLNAADAAMYAGKQARKRALCDTQNAAARDLASTTGA